MKSILMMLTLVTVVLDHLNLWQQFIHYIVYWIIIFICNFFFTNIGLLKVIARTNNDLGVNA